ncbi:hypothetical protein HDV00_003047 [Rhizophlyctis rosea]|nr:hypothetical protein HDV00_003047 [Rhizophlyctis rosea]
MVGQTVPINFTAPSRVSQNAVPVSQNAVPIAQNVAPVSQTPVPVSQTVAPVSQNPVTDSETAVPPIKLMPTELQIQILNYLDTYHDVGKMLMCREWVKAVNARLYELVDIRTVKQIKAVEESVIPAFKRRQEVERYPGPPVLPFKSIVLRPEGAHFRGEKNEEALQKYKEKTGGCKSQKEFKKKTRDGMKTVIAASNFCTSLTIQGRPEIMRYVMRAAPEDDPDPIKDAGVQRTLRKLETLDLSGCQTASTDHRLDWILDSICGGIDARDNGPSEADPKEGTPVPTEGVAEANPSEGVVQAKSKQGAAKLKFVDGVRQANLKRLLLPGCFALTDKVFAKFGKHFANLQELDLSGNYTPQKKLSWKKPHVTEFAAMCAQLKQLKTLHYTPRFRPPEGPRILKAIFGITTLEEVDLVHMDRLENPPNGPDSLMNEVEFKCSNLKRLTIRRSPGRPQIIKGVLKECPQIQHIAIVQCGDLNDDTCKLLCDPESVGDIKYRPEKLRSFSLKHCGGYRRLENTVVEILSKATSMTHLTLKDHPNKLIPSMSTTRILTAISAHRGLKYVELSYANMNKFDVYRQFAYIDGHVDMVDVQEDNQPNQGSTSGPSGISIGGLQQKAVPSNDAQQDGQQGGSKHKNGGKHNSHDKKRARQKEAKRVAREAEQSDREDLKRKRAADDDDATEPRTKHHKAGHPVNKADGPSNQPVVPPALTTTGLKRKLPAENDDNTGPVAKRQKEGDDADKPHTSPAPPRKRAVFSNTTWKGKSILDLNRTPSDDVRQSLQKIFNGLQFLDPTQHAGQPDKRSRRWYLKIHLDKGGHPYKEPDQKALAKQVHANPAWVSNSEHYKTVYKEEAQRKKDNAKKAKRARRAPTA